MYVPFPVAGTVACTGVEVAIGEEGVEEVDEVEVDEPPTSNKENRTKAATEDADVVSNSAEADIVDPSPSGGT